MTPLARYARPLSNDPDLWVFDWLNVTRAPKRFSGGAGMASTASDYFRLLQMLVNGGTLDGVRLLSPMTVRWALADQIGTMRGVAHPGDGYSWNLVNPVPVERRRRARSLATSATSSAAASPDRATSSTRSKSWSVSSSCKARRSAPPIMPN